jgi:undecaprenyl-diphosphatase
VNTKIEEFRKENPKLVTLFVELLIGNTLILLLGYLSSKISEQVVMKQTYWYDNAISAAFYNLRGVEVTGYMETLSFIGKYGIAAATGVLLFMLLKRRRFFEMGVLFTTMVLGLLANLALKLTFIRPRPDIAPLAVENSYSFPSGHSMSAMIFFMIFTYLFYHFTHRVKASIWVLIIASLFTIGIGISRIYLGVHYPSDVLGGYLMGLLWVMLILVIIKTRTLVKTLRHKKLIK